jgi:hypothetical protein
MELQAVEGYFNNGHFYQNGNRVQLPERQLVIVNMLGIPINIDETGQADIEFWKEFDNLLADSADEELSIEDFPRTSLHKKLVVLDDDGVGESIK